MVVKANWQFFLRSEVAWEQMLSACREAKSTIDLEQFIFLPDLLGESFLEVLLERARAGLQVRLLVDALGSRPLLLSNWPEQLKAAGIKVRFFNPLWFRDPNKYTGWFFRDHRKLLIVDRKRGFTGSVCLGEWMRNWRDTHLAITGPVVEDFHWSFEKMWSRAGKQRYSGLPLRRRFESRALDNDFVYLSNTPLPGQRHLYYQLRRWLKGARREIYLTTPYFSPDWHLLYLIKRARRRQVDVRLLLPANSDHPIVDLAARSFFTRLLEWGVKIYLYQGNMLHAKTMIIDDWASVGSLNLDNISLRYNFEGNLVSRDRAFVNSLRQHFINDLDLSLRVDTPIWNRRSYLQRWAELLVAPIRWLL